MKRLILLGVILSVLPVSLLYAFGKKDIDDKERLNDEWLLCVTAFDFSLMSPVRSITGDVIVKELVNKLNSINYRLRLSPEYMYYESYAWQQAVNAAAKALSAKQNERSQLLYRGDQEWRYRSNLKKVDADIEKLKEALAQKEAEKPLISSTPSFALSQNNINGVYPPPPQPGTERRFCREQNADAILSGSIREFHGRYYVNLNLFTLYTNSWVYEDDIIFSLEDIDGAVEEITARLAAALSGNRPAVVAITANPPESQILINQSYAGRGAVEERERSPGDIVISVMADGFSSETVETELNAGELAEIDVTLGPLHYADVNINVPDNAEDSKISVYHGALYVGEAPLTLRLPIDQLNYIIVENQKNTAKAVFTSPDMPGETSDISLKMKPAVPSGQQLVNKARRRHYWTWGGTWITGITAWITYGIYQNRYAAMPEDRSTQVMRGVSIGAFSAAGVVVGYGIFRMIRYLYTSSEKATPVIRQEKQKK